MNVLAQATFTTGEFWSILSSVVSIIVTLLLGALAIGLSIWFFMVNRKTEQNVSNSLTKIETQTAMLQKITGRQLDRLTKYVTEPKPSMLEEWLPQLMTVLSQLPDALVSQPDRLQTTQNIQQLQNVLVVCYIAIYFYTAQTNCWAQEYLPNADEFNEDDLFHTTTKSIVDMSAADCVSSARILENTDPAQLAASPLQSLLVETRDFWKDHVRTTAQVYEDRGKKVAGRTSAKTKKD